MTVYSKSLLQIDYDKNIKTFDLTANYIHVQSVQHKCGGTAARQWFESLQF